MQIVRFDEGFGGSNAYLIYDENTKDAVIFDPGFDDDRFIDYINENNLNLNKIILTHGHYDHIGGVQNLRKKTGATLYIPEGDKDFLVNPGLNLSGGFGNQGISIEPADVTVKENDIIEISPGNNLTVIEAPGHTPGSAVFLGDQYLIAGDVLFQGSIGRTDFPGSSYSDMMHSLDKLMKLDDEIIVLPGHGNPTTIGQERQTNPFIN